LAHGNHGPRGCLASSCVGASVCIKRCCIAANRLLRTATIRANRVGPGRRDKLVRMLDTLFQDAHAFPPNTFHIVVAALREARHNNLLGSKQKPTAHDVSAPHVQRPPHRSNAFRCGATTTRKRRIRIKYARTSPIARSISAGRMKFSNGGHGCNFSIPFRGARTRRRCTPVLLLVEK